MVFLAQKSFFLFPAPSLPAFPPPSLNRCSVSTRFKPQSTVAINLRL